MARRDVGRRRWGTALAALVLSTLAGGPAPEGDEPDDGSFGMTTPVVCKEIRGYEDFDPLAVPALTSDEKLLVYYRPRHYKSSRKGESFLAHFTQDGRIRRRGEKAVLWSKKNLLDYTAKAAEPPKLIYMRNTISLKILKPGDYEYDVVLRDEIGASAAAVRTVPFRVVPAREPAAEPKKGGPGTPDSP